MRPSPANQVRIKRRHRIHLFLEPDRVLPGERVLEVGIKDHLRLRGQRHLTREHLHIGQPAEWILEESRLAVVEDGHRHHVVVQLFDVGDVVGGKREVQAGAAANHEIAGAACLVVEPNARSHVGQVRLTLLVAEITLLDAVVDENGGVGDIRRIHDAEVGIPAQAIIDGQRLGHSPRISKPEADLVLRHPDLPVIRVEVLVEFTDERVEAGEIPLRRIVPRVHREAAQEIRRPRIEDVIPGADDEPIARVAEAEELAPHLRAMTAAEPR